MTDRCESCGQTVTPSPNTRAAYAHHNEEADLVWWQEVGRHPEPDSGMTKEDYLEAMHEDPDHELWR